MIRKIGAIILKDKQLLVVRKKGKEHAEFIIPGGKSEGNETHLETLARELREELGVSFEDPIHFGTFEDIAVFEQVPIVMDVYSVRVVGEPKPASEIKEYVWIDRNYATHGIVLGSVLARFVIPGLIERGEM